MLSEERAARSDGRPQSKHPYPLIGGCLALTEDANEGKTVKKPKNRPLPKFLSSPLNIPIPPNPDFLNQI